MIVNVCFVKRPRQYWFDYFIGRYKHCFICIMDTKLMIYNLTVKGLIIKEGTDDDFIDVEVIQVEVKEMGAGRYRTLLTCADFCGSLLGVRGIILTPNNLRRKLLWEAHQKSEHKHQQN
jgi:hypothetical protein